MVRAPGHAESGRVGPLRLPIGLQLYTVSDRLETDFDGTLHRVAAIGYQAVEFAHFPEGRTGAALRHALRAEGLRCVSAHFAPPNQDVADLRAHVEPQIAFAADMGLKYVVYPFVSLPKAGPIREQVAALELTDWHRNADMLNTVGALAKSAGLRLAYHNHNMEFRAFDGVVAYDELLRRTQPDLVDMEMDCGWVVAAGADPVRYLREHAKRFPLLHIKDVVPAPNTELKMLSTEVGRGMIDWKAVFAAAHAAGLVQYYVEQEPPFARSSLESVQDSYRYLRNLRI
jgi:sugar phosphate isomerase/epimerase